MIEGIHKHLLHELERAGRADTVFILAGVSFNMLMLFINWNLAGDMGSRARRNFSNASQSLEEPLLLLLFMLGSVVVTLVCISTLRNSQKMCTNIRSSLKQIYQSTDVFQYMPDGVSELGKKRLKLSLVAVGVTGLLAILVPLIVLFAS